MISYFTYGSNLNLERAVKRGVKIYKAEKATLHNWELTFTVINDAHEQAGFANIRPAKGQKVEGAIIYTDESSITSLDEYEAFPIDYLKKEITVEKKNGEWERCFAYVGNKKRMRKNLRPTREYLDHILEGRPFFSEKYFNRLRSVRTV